VARTIAARRSVRCDGGVSSTVGMVRDADQWPRYGLLLSTLVACVAVQGTVPAGAVQQIVVSALLGTGLVLAFRIARVSRLVMALAWAIAAIAVAVAVVRALGDAVGDGEARAINAVVAALGPPAVAIGVVRNLRMSGAVTIQTVLGVLALYLLLGMFFAFVFGAIDRLGGDPFFADGTPATVAKCLYYSFTTLATVGYGDLTARTDLGHTLSIFEALAGQIYLVTVVSLIVSNLGRRAAASPDSGDALRGEGGLPSDHGDHR
jgi:hypothetical protein